MKIFELLNDNKGTVSSSLGKELAEKALAGDKEILSEAIQFTVFEPDNPDVKHIRSGAAKIVEIVAEARPNLVAGSLEKLMPALKVAEPQTRWMIIRVMGFCARSNSAVSKKAVPYAVRYIERKEGLCISSSADLFLGDLGAISPELAAEVLPVLLKSVETMVLNEQDWLLESFIKIIPNLPAQSRTEIAAFAKRWQDSGRKTTQARVKKLLKVL